MYDGMLIADTVASQDVVDAFHQGQHVYVANGADTESGIDASQVRQAVEGHGDVYVAILPGTVAGDPAQVRSALGTIEGKAGPNHSYVVVGPGGFAVHRPDGKSTEVFDAATSHAHGRTAEVVFAVEHASAGSDTGADGGGIGAGGIVLTLLVLAVVIALIVRRFRGSGRGRAAIGASRSADVQSEIDTLGDDLRITDPGGNPEVVGVDPDGDPVHRALQVAWSRHSAAAGMLAGARSQEDVERARVLAAQGRSALEHAHRLRDGVPGESEVYQKAAASGGPDPRQRMDEAPSDFGGGRGQRVLQQYTPASYPGYGYGFYPGYGYGFFDYGGSFITGMLAGELLTGAFGGPGLFGGWGGGGYGYGYDQGYGQGYDQGYDQGPGDIGGGDWGGGDMGGGDWGGGDMGGGGGDGGGGW